MPSILHKREREREQLYQYCQRQRNQYTCFFNLNILSLYKNGLHERNIYVLLFNSSITWDEKQLLTLAIKSANF